MELFKTDYLIKFMGRSMKIWGEKSMDLELLYIIYDMAVRREGDPQAEVRVEDLLGLLHDLWVMKGVAVASDCFQVIDMLRFLRERGMIEYDEDEGTVRLTDEGLERIERKLRAGYYPFRKRVSLIM